MQINTQDHSQPILPQTELRPPETVMRLERMGSFFPTRLSFLRSLLRDMASQKVGLSRFVNALDDDGYGHCVYEVEFDNSIFSLIAWSSPLDAENRTDRVIAEAWDSCFVLFDGRPTAQDIALLGNEATRQEAGRYDSRVLVLSRANKSVRLFDHVVDALSKGQQPDEKAIRATGYLMRTTAVYGNGKFGLADRSNVVERGSLALPFRLEMLTVFLIREFTLDLANHVARVRGGAEATQLSDRLSRQLGVGNSTGLGMAPFLIGHPVLINNWMLVRETALARVRKAGRASPSLRAEFRALADHATRHLEEWNVPDETEQKRIETLRAEWTRFRLTIDGLLDTDQPWDRMIEESMASSVDLQELVVALVLEPQGELVDGLCDCMLATYDTLLDPAMRIDTLRDLIEQHYGWALSMDLEAEEATAMVWYVSEEKLEPRFGASDVVDGDHQAMPHDIPAKVQAVYAELKKLDNGGSVAWLLAAHPQHRAIVRRIQTIGVHPYGEVRDNLLSENMRPIDLLRCKLSFFGASKFDPKSDRWTRITLYQGAPRLGQLTPLNAADCFMPAFGTP